MKKQIVILKALECLWSAAWNGCKAGCELCIMLCAERYSRINMKPPSESAAKAWFNKLTNALQQMIINAIAFLVLLSNRILALVSDCRNLHSALPSFSKDGCTPLAKSVLRLAKRPNNFAARTNSQEFHFSHAKRSRMTLVSNPKSPVSVSHYSKVRGISMAALHSIRVSGANRNVFKWVGRVNGASPRT